MSTFVCGTHPGVRLCESITYARIAEKQFALYMLITDYRILLAVKWWQMSASSCE